MKAPDQAAIDARIDAALDLPEASQVGEEHTGRDIQHLAIVTDLKGHRAAYRSIHRAIEVLGYWREGESYAWILAERALLKAGASTLQTPNGDVLEVRLILSTQASRRLLKPIFADRK